MDEKNFDSVNDAIETDERTEIPSFPVSHEPPSRVSTGKKVGSFIVFALAIFSSFIFIVSSIFTLTILLGGNETDSASEALGAIFTILFSLPTVLISAVPTFLFNILSSVFFGKIRRQEGTTLFKVFHILSGILLCLVILLGIGDAIVFLK